MIVGLGNPGPAYARTRHNAGALLVDHLRGSWAFPPLRERAGAFVSQGILPQSPHAVVLAIPTTFMNESGTAVSALVRELRTPLKRLVILHDDKDVTVGSLKLQKDRGAAGHRGVQSVHDALGSHDYWRLRIGIGTETQEVPTENFVLEPFTAQERETLRRLVFPTAIEHLQALVRSQ